MPSLTVGNDEIEAMIELLDSAIMVALADA
jgi:hypothetical protein